MNPWGIVQKLPCIRGRARGALHRSLSPNIPFTMEVISNNLSTEEKVATIAQRQLALELFLKDYVVKVDNIVYGNVALEEPTLAVEKA
jgi:hypothetical protein